MNCPNCLNQFDQKSHSPLITECGHTFCLTCCKNFDNQVPLKLTCPTCNAFLKSKFQTLSKNYSLLQLIDQETIISESFMNSKCGTHQKSAFFICENCCLELCNSCVSTHSSLGHGIVDIDRFIEDLDNRDKDMRLFVEKAKKKYEFYDILIKIKNEIMKKEIAAKFDFLGNPTQIQESKTNSLNLVDKAFKNLNLTPIFNMASGQGQDGSDIRTCINEFQNIQSKDNQREKAILYNQFLRKYKTCEIKDWIEKDNFDQLKAIIDKIQYRMPCPNSNNNFQLDTNSKVDFVILFNQLLKENEDYGLEQNCEFIHLPLKHMIEKTNFQFSYPEMFIVNDLNANLCLWNSNKIQASKGCDYFYLKSDVNPYLLLTCYDVIKQVYISVQPSEENYISFQEDLANTLIYLADKLETIQLIFVSDPTTSIINRICENFTLFRKLKNLRLYFTKLLASDLSLKLMDTLMKYGHQLERLELYNVSTGGELQLTDFFKTLNQKNKLFDFSLRCVTSDYLEPHLPKVLSKYTNLINLSLDIDWSITQKSINDFASMIKQLSSLVGLSIAFNLGNEIDVKEFFESVILAPKLQLFEFVLASELGKEYRTFDEELFARLLKKNLHSCTLELPKNLGGEKFITRKVINDVRDFYKGCKYFNLDLNGQDLEDCLYEFLSLFSRKPGMDIMKNWDLSMDSTPNNVENNALTFLSNIPDSSRIHFAIRFDNSEQFVDLEVLISKLKSIKKEGKYSMEKLNECLTVLYFNFLF